ncbi:hypothetical protein K2173_021512 [Erythroxylum novogranatense]|uniref:HpcH/HpaI aldolase/citrate lyase domain-containing protein n=1 Tax=Erythroxylum novogranatense TaxID=1862640 RepID=A0AAV8TR30_9ROSI|nr:hypothetical protein K2173_021512 [Erythroxylum novogranatense]
MPALVYHQTSAASVRSSLPSNPEKPSKTPFLPSKSLFNFKPLNPTASTLTSIKPLRSTVSPSDLTPVDSSFIATSISSLTSKKSLKSLLQSGETLYGLFLLSFSPTLAEIAGLSGYDFVVVDMEHGPGGITEALHCLRVLAATETPAIIRLPDCCPVWAKKALDLGPQGIMFPMIDSPKMAKKAVSYCRFPPAGVRGSAHTVVRASKYGIDEGYLSNYEDELLIMCQVESEEGVENAKQIAAVDGVDCIQMGPLDLSASMGYLWDPGHKKVTTMMRAAEKAVLGSNPGNGCGAYLAGFAMPHDDPTDLKSRGYNMVSGAVDVGLFRRAAMEDVKNFKSSFTEGSDDDDGDSKEDEKYWSE